MAQTWPSIDQTELLKDTRTELTDRDETLKSCYSGTSFPTLNLVVGMLCFRTDQEKLYQLRALTPTWVLIADLAKTYLAKNDADTFYAPLSHNHDGAAITTGTVAAARLPAAVQQVQALSGTGGSLNITGVNSGYAGLFFADATIQMRLLLSQTVQGVQNNAGTWQWQFTSGSLSVGAVPWARLTSVPTNALGNRTVSTSAPSGGADGDIWLRY